MNAVAVLPLKAPPGSPRLRATFAVFFSRS
jgi:hypothetical protein